MYINSKRRFHTKITSFKVSSHERPLLILTSQSNILLKNQLLEHVKKERSIIEQLLPSLSTLSRSILFYVTPFDGRINY